MAAACQSLLPTRNSLPMQAAAARMRTPRACMLRSPRCCNQQQQQQIGLNLSNPQQFPPAVSLDVEYAHIVLQDGSRCAVPAWIALVGWADDRCTVLLDELVLTPEVGRHAFVCVKGGIGVLKL